MGEKKLYSIKEICEIYSLKRKTVDKAIHSARLKSYQVDRKQRKLKIKDVDNWLESLAYKTELIDLKKIAAAIVCDRTAAIQSASPSECD